MKKKLKKSRKIRVVKKRRVNPRRIYRSMLIWIKNCLISS